MILIILGIFVFVAIGVVGWLIFKELKKSEMKFSGSKNATTKSVQEELGFKDIRSGIIDLGNHCYRLVCEVGAINYRLRSETEQETIELRFNQFVTSLSWPIQIYIQSRKLDNTDLVNNERLLVEQTISEFPQLKDYAEKHLDNLTDLPKFIGTNIIKKNYIIIPYDGVGALEKLTDEEKYEEAIRELSNRMSTIMDGLKRIGIICRPLDSLQLAELLFTTFNRDRIGQHKAILTGDLMELSVKSIFNYAPPISLEDKVHDILTGLETYIKTESDGNNPKIQAFLDNLSEINKTSLFNDDLTSNTVPIRIPDEVSA